MNYIVIDLEQGGTTKSLFYSPTSKGNQPILETKAISQYTPAKAHVNQKNPCADRNYLGDVNSICELLIFKGEIYNCSFGLVFNERTFLIFLEGNLKFLLTIHYNGTVPGNWFADRLACYQEKPDRFLLG
jgi:hypothetical protein